MFLAMLWKNKTLLVYGIIALIVGLYIGALKIQIHNLKNVLKEQETVIAQTRIDLEMEKAKAVKLQGAISVMVEEGNRKSANAAMWKKKYEESIKKLQEFTGGLISWKPQPSEDECAATKRLLREYRK